MRIKAVFIRGIMVVGVLLSPLVFSDNVTPEKDGVTPEKLAEQCKKEAQETGVHPGDTAAYVRECLSDYGVEAVDVEKVVEQMKLKDQNDN